jgi:uncharacterized protein (TIGR02231 family)
MKYSILVILSLSTLFSSAQKTIDTKSTLKEVTVFLKGAQLTRAALTEIPIGTSVVKIIGMSPYLDRNTLLVKGLGEFTILSVRHQLNYLNEKNLEEKYQVLNDTIEALTDKLEDLQNELATLVEKESFLKLNQTVKGTEQLDAEKLKAVHQYFGDQLNLIRIEKSKKTRKIKELSVIYSAFATQLAQEKIKKHEAESEVLVEVNATKAVKAEFIVSYMVIHAAWFPSYDIRVNNVQAPLKLFYKANISQTTGENWNNVVLTISNANPYLSSSIPELNPWYLNFVVEQNYYKKGGTSAQPSMNSYISNNTKQVSGRVQDKALLQENRLEKCYVVEAKTPNGLEAHSNILCLPFKPVVFLPNAISPNNDNLNESFKPQVFGITEYHLQIYNRWGQLVYSGTNGSWIPKKSDSGVFMYTLQLQTNQGGRIQQNGTITVLR